MTTTFLTGPAGTGKTTRATEWLHELLARGVPGHTILVVVPQRTLAQPYHDLLSDPRLPGGAGVDVLTFQGLALRTINLFWPLVARQAGFARSEARPVFLTVETAQYYLRQVLDPLLKQGFFDPTIVPVNLPLPRLMSQILDNLNKAAVTGLPHTQVGQRLFTALMLDAAGRLAMEQVQECMNRFRAFCLDHNLLDFSLQIELFAAQLWPSVEVRRYLTGRYHHLIVDNLEEDTPFAHAILRDWLPEVETVLLVYDEDAGYRLFLGANWRTAHNLQTLCDETIRLSASYIASPDMLDLGRRLAGMLKYRAEPEADYCGKQADLCQPTATTQPGPLPDPRRTLVFEQTRFYPQMIDAAVKKVEALIAEGAKPGEIVVLAPFVPDTLSLSFTERMRQRNIPLRTHRPSHSFTEEPVARAMLTLARLAFPEWELLPHPFDVTLALRLVIADLDPIRASLLTRIVYRPARQLQGEGVLTSFEWITGTARDRITEPLSRRFETLRLWLQRIHAEEDGPLPLDLFFSRLFSEVLARPGFGFYQQAEAGSTVANLIVSAAKFRRAVEQVSPKNGKEGISPAEPPTINELNQAYIAMIAEGVTVAQYLSDWDATATNAILLTPVTTFLMLNRAAEYQVWLDVGSSSWWERISQPLTHPYILSAEWEAGRTWTDQEEFAAQQDRLARLVLGLTRRCRRQVIALSAEIGEQGQEQRGQLLHLLLRLRHEVNREMGREE